ncbi:MAG: basic amino acid ABC transporter substrate-binding protein [Anaerolineae bacterium]|nr:basic amino acid ABC transporter substrate-binding protein [Anaerolineae bacterium]
MKRSILYALVGIALVGLLAACGGTSTGQDTVRVATDATWPPFESINESTKEIEGFDIDLLTAVADKAGLEIEFINVPFDPLLAGMSQCQYDAAISSITITEDRKKEFLFSDPYFAAGQIVAVQIDESAITGKDTLNGKTIGVQLGTTGEIEANKITGATVSSYDDIGLAFQDLMNGQVNAVIADNPTVLSYVGQNSDKIKVVGEAFTDEYYGIAVCKNKPELVKKINQGLAAVEADGVLDQLADKWLKPSGD